MAKKKPTRLPTIVSRYNVISPTGKTLQKRKRPPLLPKATFKEKMAVKRAMRELGDPFRNRKGKIVGVPRIDTYIKRLRERAVGAGHRPGEKASLREQIRGLEKKIRSGL